MRVFWLIIKRIRRRLRMIADSFILEANRLRFHLFFKSQPADGEYCNSKRIHLVKEPADDREHRAYLAIIRCGANHRLVDDGSQRQFDIALSLYARPNDKSLLDGCEYAYTGGINKYKAARQFINGALLEKFRGFIFLDDDLEITYTHLGQFLDYCWAHGFRLAQPSLTSDSFYNHEHLLNASRTGWRSVDLVEVMCPYFSSDALRVALNTFELSSSTWGLDDIWPRLLELKPVVIDEFTIKHTRPVRALDGPFYKYMRSIGVSPQREWDELTNISQERVRSMAGMDLLYKPNT
jgi:hypothetical protein